MSRAGVALAAALAGTVAGCASTPPAGPRPLSMSAQRGLNLAQVRCAQCHAIQGGAGFSPRVNAPPFSQLRLRFNQITWTRALASIAAGGHDEMPSFDFAGSDVDDLEAYLRTLRP